MFIVAENQRSNVPDKNTMRSVDWKTWKKTNSVAAFIHNLSIQKKIKKQKTKTPLITQRVENKKRGE